MKNEPPDNQDFGHCASLPLTEMGGGPEEPMDIKPFLRPVPDGLYVNSHGLEGSDGNGEEALVSESERTGMKPNSSVGNPGQNALSGSTEGANETEESEQEGAEGPENEEPAISRRDKTPPVRSRMFCERCHRVFFSKTIFDRHMDDCEPIPFEKHSSSVVDQELYKKKGGYYQCKRCQFRSHHRETVVNHANCHQGKFQCTVCHQEMDTLRGLQKHREIAHRSRALVTAKAATTQSMDSGDNTESEDESVSVDKANSVSDDKTDADENKDTEGSDSIIPGGELIDGHYKCKLCPLKTPSRFHFNRHILLHKLPDARLCPKCKRPFASAYLVRKHMRKVHRTTRTDGIQIEKSQGDALSGGSGRQGEGRCRLKSSRSFYKKIRGRSQIGNSQHAFIQSCTLRDGTYFCRHCNFRAKRPFDLTRHSVTRKHKLIAEKSWLIHINGVYKCTICHFKAKDNHHFEAHIDTTKHKSLFKEWYCKLVRNKRNGSVETVDTERESETPQTEEESKTRPEARKNSAKKLKRNESPGCHWQQVNSPNQSAPKALISPGNSTVVKKKASVSPSPGENCESPAVELETAGSDSVKHSDGGLDFFGNQTLVTDLADFAQRPFACSLCFYRTGILDDLRLHVKNHLTGGSPDSRHVPCDTTSVIDDFVGRPKISPQPQDEFSTPNLPQAPVHHYAGFENKPTISQFSNMDHIITPQPHYSRMRTGQEAHTTPYGVRSTHLPCQTSQSSFINSDPGGRSMPGSPFGLGDPAYNSIQQSRTSRTTMNAFDLVNQFNTEDLLDLGLDFLKSPGNLDPYECLYCRTRQKSLAGMVAHFETLHTDIVQFKNRQATMRSEAAMSIVSGSQSRPREAGVKVEIID